MRTALPAAIVMPLALSACASIVSQSDETFTLSSTPDNASFTIADENGTNVYSGTTPITVTLPKSGGYFNGRDYTITFEREGYRPYRTTVSSGPSGWYLAGNLVFGGLIGWLIVDPATGAMWTFDETEVHAQLTPAGPVPMSGPSPTNDAVPMQGYVPMSSLDGQTVTVMTLDQVPPEQRRYLVPLDPG